MKILMFHGRAGGHNIIPFLEFFNSSNEHKLTFFYSNDRTFFPEKENISFHKLSFSLSSFLNFLKLTRKPYDLIWYHGGHSAFIFYLFTKLRNRKSKFIFNVWNEWLIHKAKKGGIKGWLFKSAIKNSDVIHCNWHGTVEVLKSTGWNNNIKVFYWGLHRQYFESAENHELQEETRNFVSVLPSDKIKFFFPKSISSNSRHDLIVDAAKILQDSGIHNFIVYFWIGNTNDPELMDRYENDIINKGVQENVKLTKHSFLPFHDLIYIWKHMDSGLQIAANEQLSTTLLEPLFFQKEIVATDILPYRIFNEKFPVNIPLIKIDANEIADAMGKIIKGEKTDEDLLQLRQQVVAENFDMQKNLSKILDYYKKNP